MAPAKTLYVKDKDLPLWERFEKAAEWSTIPSVSGLISQAMSHYLNQFGDQGEGLYVEAPDEDQSAPGFRDGYTAIVSMAQNGWELMYLDDNGDPDIYPLPRGDVSAAIADARQFLQHRQSLRSQPIHAIEVEVGSGGESHTERFQGRWLVWPERDETRAAESDYDDGTQWDAGIYYGVAVTRRGQFAVYAAHCNQDGGMLTVLPTREELEADEIPRSILAAALAELDGAPMVIERDI